MADCFDGRPCSDIFGHYFKSKQNKFVGSSLCLTL